MLFSSVPVLALVATIATANPILLEKRAQVTCGSAPYYFGNSAQNKGYTDAENHLNALPPTTVLAAPNSLGERNPHYYGNSEGIVFPKDECNSNIIRLNIYPVFIGGETFTDGKAANLDRVVIAEKNGGALVRCGLITHRGVANNGFQLCK
uniref:Uncharacterized protein n=1 Tax=Passalora fulva TaxID=5499 RepID=A0A1P8YXS6_PASFU|nr:hypothetical protein 27 [Fulvia fulva]